LHFDVSLGQFLKIWAPLRQVVNLGCMFLMFWEGLDGGSAFPLRSTFRRVRECFYVAALVESWLANHYSPLHRSI
jgi:hypothetical protein